MSASLGRQGKTAKLDRSALLERLARPAQPARKEIRVQRGHKGPLLSRQMRPWEQWGRLAPQVLAVQRATPGRQDLPALAPSFA